MKYIIFSDIDGTIYPHTKEIHPDNLKAIKKAQDAGIEFVLCTGNGYFDIVKELANKLNVRYAITSNGASIFDVQKNDFIFKATLDKDIADKMLQFSLENNIATNFWDTENVYVNKHTSEYVVDIIKKVMFGNRKPKVSEKITSDIFKIEFYDEEDKINKMMEFTNSFNLQRARMRDIHVEITANNVSKGDGIKWLCQNQGWDIKNTMGIGDSANDLPMFEVVGHAYAMGNGSEEVKSKAHYLTTNVEDGGLARAIEEFIKIAKK